ncbi:MAG: cysteine desulfurase [Clostridiales bacterium]|nr:cysteine desulfurase [Clostridiales bacterium]
MIYLDNAATTRMYKECMDVYEKYACELYYNPSALYSQSMIGGEALKQARLNLAKKLSVNPQEIYFTASGSEGDNMAFISSIKQKKGKILISSVEHAAVYNMACHMKEQGFDLDFVDVDAYGRVILADFRAKMTKDVIFCSIMHVCNETGAINPIRELCQIAKEINPRCIFHSDGVQAFGKIPVNLKNLGVDVYTISSHKIHGPKGVGAIYIKESVHPKTFIYGGGQENNIRSATENVPGIAAFSKAIDMKIPSVLDEMQGAKEKQKYIMDYISKFDDCIINTNIENSSPYIVSFSLKNVRGEGVVHTLEAKDIIIGTGSACSAKKGLKRIPQALNLDPAYHNGMLRISFDTFDSYQDIDTALDELAKAIIIERNLQK